jgi:Domain of unknown function (DUF4177)
MPFVTCPSCGEKGKVPSQLVGVRIKCKKCNNSFLVTPPAPKPAAVVAAAATPGAAAAAAPRGDTIEVDGLDESSWSVSPVVTAEHDPDHEHHEHEHDEASSAFAAHPEGHTQKRYKILTSKDKFFGNTFDLARLEDALNHYASQGWVVRSMATPHIAGFSGGAKEELVILLER